MNLTLRFLFYLLVMCTRKDVVSLAIFTHGFSLFRLIKFKSVLFYINSLFKRKRVLKLTQEIIKIPKVSYFSFSFKLNEKKKMPFKKYGMERKGYKKIFAGEGV